MLLSKHLDNTIDKLVASHYGVGDRIPNSVLYEELCQWVSSSECEDRRLWTLARRFDRWP